MDKKIFWLNIVLTVMDTLVSLLSIAAFTAIAYWFGKWWITLFGLLPMLMFYDRGLLLERATVGSEEAEND